MDWEGGVAGVAVAHGSVVWGVVYELTEEHVAALDRYEGYLGPANDHNLYERERVWVELTRADDGSIPRRVRAEYYVPRVTNPALPSRRYLDAIIEGAHSAPPARRVCCRIAADADGGPGCELRWGVSVVMSWRGVTGVE